MDNSLKKSQENEFELKDLFRILGSYKWLILFVMIIFLILSSVYLSFTPFTYSTNAIIEVKSRNSVNSDDLLQNAFYATNTEIDKEIEILKTFNINKKVIDKMDFKTQIFLKEGYKKNELYGGETPVNISDINISNEEVIGKLIKLIPQEGGYTLEFEHSQRDTFSHFILQKKMMKFSIEKLFKYDETITTEYFSLSVKKKKEIEKPLYFIIYGDSRTIYDSIVKRKLRIEQLNQNAPLITISYEDNIPERATVYVNKLIEVFLHEGVSNKIARNDKIRDFISNQLKSTKKKLNRSEKKLEDYKTRNKIIQTSTQADMIIRKLSGFEVQISENKFRNRLIDNLLEDVRRGRVSAIGSSLAEINDQPTLNLVTRLQELELEENRLGSEYTGEYPELITVRNRLKAIRSKIYLNIKNLKVSVNARVEDLKKLKQKAEKNLLSLPKKEIDLIDLARKHEVNSDMYAYLLEQKSKNDMIRVATVSDYKITERAYSPNVPIKPKGSLVMFLSMILGLMMGIFISILHNNLSSKIKNITDIENSTQLLVNGIIPFSKKKKGIKIEVFDRLQSEFTESYRRFRTELQFLFKSNESNIILATSMVANEGKSTVVANLGAVFQLAGYNVVVIDLDLRKSSLHKYFDIDYGVGVSNYLSGTANLSDIIFPSTVPGLDIIPVGSLPANPSELILSKRVESMLEKLKDRYDYVLIDSTSIGSVTDTLSLMKYTDVNLVIFRANNAKKIYIEKLKKMIKKYDLKNIGLVLNAVNPRFLEE